MTGSLVPAQPADAVLLQNLFQLYAYDFAEILGGNVRPDGTFPTERDAGKRDLGLGAERDTGVEPVSQPWEGWAQPIYQSRSEAAILPKYIHLAAKLQTRVGLVFIPHPAFLLGILLR